MLDNWGELLYKRKSRTSSAELVSLRPHDILPVDSLDVLLIGVRHALDYMTGTDLSEFRSTVCLASILKIDTSTSRSVRGETAGPRAKGRNITGETVNDRRF